MEEKDINILYFDFGNHIEKNILRKICFNSWKKFFPNANYICISEENKDFKKFIEQDEFTRGCFKANNLCFLADSYRLYLTSIYDNLLYLDTDVYIRKDLMKLLNENDELCGCQFSKIVKDGYLVPDKEKALPQNGTFLWTKNKTDKFKPIVDFYKNEKFEDTEFNIVVNEKFNYLFNILENDREYFNHLHLSMFKLYNRFQKIVPIKNLISFAKNGIYQARYLFVVANEDFCDGNFDFNLNVCPEFFNDLVNTDDPIILKDLLS